MSETSTNKTIRDIVSCIKMGIKLGNAVCYPFVKSAKLPDMVASEVKSSVDFDSPKSLSELRKIREISAPGNNVPNVAFMKFSLGEGIAEFTVKVLYAADKLILLGTITNYLANVDNGNFHGLKINKTVFSIIKWTLFGVIVTTIALKISGILPERVRKFADKVQSYISDLVIIGFAIWGFYLLYKLISAKLDGKEWTKYDTEILIGIIVTTLELSDISLIEKKLARQPKVYYALVGVSTVAKVASAIMPLLTENTPLRINKAEVVGKNKFDNVKIGVDGNTLFLYFCGTRETTAIHLNQFMMDIKAKHQIYVSGVGSPQTVYKKSGDDDLDVTEKLIGNNSQKYSFQHRNRSVTCIEKFYDGDDLGYRVNDSEQVANYALKAFEDVLSANPNIDKIVFAGHSRGAAVGLPSFLYKLLEAAEKTITRLKTCKSVVFPLDPVAGQTSNGYHMGNDWTTQDLYKKLQNSFGDNISICEIWARSAPMIGSVIDFHPARRYMQDPANLSIKLVRLQLGYKHSAMVSAKQEYHERYTSLNLESPYKLLVKLINEYIAMLPDLSNTKFNEISSTYNDLFDKNDGKAIEGGYPDFDKGKRTSCKDRKGDEINFDNFIRRYVSPQ